MKIAICGFYGKENFGDDLMLQYLHELFSENSNQVQVYSDAEYKISGRRSIEIKNGQKDFAQVLQADVIVIGGGGIIEPSFWALSFDNINQMIARKKKVIFVSVSVYSNQLKSNIRDSRSFVDFLKPLNALWFIREKNVADEMTARGFNAKFLADITFSDPDYQLNNKEIDRPLHPKVLIFYPNSYTFSDYFNRLKVDDWMRHHLAIESIASFLDWMIFFGWLVNIAPAHTSHLVDDRIIGGLVFSFMSNKSHVIRIPDATRNHDLLINNSDLVLSMRYHSSVIAIASGVPCIDIVHHSKNKQLWADTGLLKNTVDYRNFNKASLVNSANYLKDNLSQYQSKTKEYSLNAYQGWNIYKRDIHEFICS